MQPWPLFLAGEPAIVNRGACSKRIRGGAEQKAVPIRYRNSTIALPGVRSSQTPFSSIRASRNGSLSLGGSKKRIGQRRKGRVKCGTALDVWGMGMRGFLTGLPSSRARADREKRATMWRAYKRMNLRGTSAIDSCVAVFRSRQGA